MTRSTELPTLQEEIEDILFISSALFHLQGIIRIPVLVNKVNFNKSNIVVPCTRHTIPCCIILLVIIPDQAKQPLQAISVEITYAQKGDCESCKFLVMAPPGCRPALLALALSLFSFGKLILVHILRINITTTTSQGPTHHYFSSLVPVVHPGRFRNKSR